MSGKLLSRRQLLKSAGSTLGAISVSPVLAPSVLASAAAVLPNASVSPIKDHAAARGLLYGAATEHGRLEKDPQFAKLFAEQCGLLVPEGELKWRTLRPSPDSFNFAPADALLDFTRQHNMKFRGHVLIAHDPYPDWFNSYVNASNAKKLMVDHIRAVAGHYSGKMQSWDVVNEVLYPQDKRSDGFRNSAWMRFIGPEYLDIAFHTAREMDPNALLVWNENWLEEDTESGDFKRKCFLEQAKRLLKNNVPLQAVGLQAHLVAGHPGIAGPHFQGFLHQVSDLGLKILVTELDVRDGSLPAAIGPRDEAVAALYSQFLSAVLVHGSTVAVLTWGLSDRYTWLNKFSPRSDGLPVRGLPFDDALQPTPAYTALIKAFDSAPPR